MVEVKLFKTINNVDCGYDIMTKTKFFDMNFSSSSDF